VVCSLTGALQTRIPTRISRNSASKALPPCTIADINYVDSIVSNPEADDYEPSAADVIHSVGLLERAAHSRLPDRVVRRLLNQMLIKAGKSRRAPLAVHTALMRLHMRGITDFTPSFSDWRVAMALIQRLCDPGEDLCASTLVLDYLVNVLQADLSTCKDAKDKSLLVQLMDGPWRNQTASIETDLPFLVVRAQEAITPRRRQQDASAVKLYGVLRCLRQMVQYVWT